MKHAEGLLNKLAWVSDLPDEAMPGHSLLEIIDDRRVLIEHHKGVTEYQPMRIRVQVDFGSICVCGNDLQLARMTKGQLVICGRIESIQICRG